MTNRELEILTLITEGRSNAEIAAILGISIRTVTTHIQHIFRKLERPNRAGCAARAEAEGLRVIR
jgi:DNA-binding CsgD family transcriptional regulator